MRKGKLDRGDVKCFNCGQKGHIALSCDAGIVVSDKRSGTVEGK